MRDPPIETPHEIHLYLTTKLPDGLDNNVERALAFLFEIPNCYEFPNLLKKLKEQNDLNVTLLRGFLDICKEHRLVGIIDEYFDKFPDYKAEDEDKYAGVKKKLDKSMAPTFTQQFLLVRILIVQILMFPDNEYTEDDKVFMLDHFELTKKERERNPTLLNGFISMEQRNFVPTDKWFACDKLVIILLDIMRRNDSNELNSLIETCNRGESRNKHL